MGPINQNVEERDPGAIFIVLAGKVNRIHLNLDSSILPGHTVVALATTSRVHMDSFQLVKSQGCRQNAE